MNRTPKSVPRPQKFEDAQMSVSKREVNELFNKYEKSFTGGNAKKVYRKDRVVIPQDEIDKLYKEKQ